MVRGGTVAWGMDIPWGDIGCTESLFFPGREVRGKTGLSPGKPYPYPGRAVCGTTGLYKAGLGGWVVTWVVTGSLLFASPPRRVQGCFRPTLLCQLRFDVLAVSRCACVIAHWGQYLSRHNRTKSRLCRQCSFPHWDPTWIVLVVFCLSYSLVWWSIMSSGKLPAMDQVGASLLLPPRYQERFWASHWTWGLIDCMTWCKYSRCNGPSGPPAQRGYCESDVSARQPMYPGSDAEVV